MADQMNEGMVSPENRGAITTVIGTNTSTLVTAIRLHENLC